MDSSGVITATAITLIKNSFELKALNALLLFLATTLEKTDIFQAIYWSPFLEQFSIECRK